ncbi:corrinoid protein [Pelosinus sp. sgz500959]|uniref:corrinoid protein n=1 Tax=Pelosinus sp. sgz500959 TaxID=3242472 RepID=UPI0036732A0A
MSINHNEIFQKLSDAVVQMDEDEVIILSNEIVAQEIDAYNAIDQGLSHGMEQAGKLFEEEEYFIPELLLCSDAMYAGLDVLKPHIKVDDHGVKHKVIIGVVEGDTHDIGKNLVKIMLETSGFEIFDLGRDIPPQQFIDKAKEVNADIIALATLMTTTMDGMSEVVQLLKKENIKDQYKVIIGGGPISQSFADKIGADGYAINAADAVKLARRLVSAPIEVAV